MRVTCHQDDLRNALTLAKYALPPEFRLPPKLAAVRLEAGPLGLHVSAMGDEVSFRMLVAGEVERQGVCMTHGHTLANIVRELEHAPNILLDYQEADNALRVMTPDERTSVNLDCVLPADIPPMRTQVDDPVAFTVHDAEDHQRWTGSWPKHLEYVRPCAAQDGARLVLKGVHLTFHDRAVEFAAADGYRLAVHRVDCQTQGLDKSRGMTLPMAAVDILTRAPRSPDGWRIQLAGDGSEALFTIGDRLLVIAKSLSHEMPYPDYPAIMPKPEDIMTRAVVEVMPLRQLLDLVCRCSDIRPEILIEAAGDDPHGLLLTARLQGSAILRAVIPTTGPLTGENLKPRVRLNAKFLRDGLQMAAPRCVSLGLTGSESAVVLRPVDPEGNDRQDFGYTLMPMLLESNDCPG